MSAHVLQPLIVNTKSERKVDSLPPLGLEPVIFSTPAHLSDRSAKSHHELTFTAGHLNRLNKKSQHKNEIEQA
jgi:hypothetical protein